MLQRIWARLEFDCARAATVDGRPITLIHAGTWNRQGGPDFLSARFEIGGIQIEGDIEVHLRARDWQAHGHSSDPRYRRVALHVVLFPTSNIITRGWDEGEIPLLVLLPLLNRALEEYASDDAVERLAHPPLTQAEEALLSLSPDERWAEILFAARARWTQKCRFAGLRSLRLGWEEACHHTALEILGYRFNRVPMLAIASRFPLEWWRDGERTEVERALEAFTFQSEGWQKQAQRPANAPQRRLLQYAKWLTHRPDWPQRLLAWAEGLPAISEETFLDTAGFRRRIHCAEIWKQLAEEICGGAIAGPRFLTLVCDGFWPLLAAVKPERAEAYERFWFHGYAGDVPERLRRLMKTAGGFGDLQNPCSHGRSQGLLGWLLRQ